MGDKLQLVSISGLTGKLSLTTFGLVGVFAELTLQGFFETHLFPAYLRLTLGAEGVVDPESLLPEETSEALSP